MTSGHELKALNVVDNTRLWMICMSLGRKLNDLDTMKSLGLWMI